MTADLAILQRKLDAVAASFNAKFALLLEKLDKINVAGKPGITQVEFAKLLGITPRTVSRWVRNGKLRKENDLIPHSEVRRYLS